MCTLRANAVVGEGETEVRLADPGRPIHYGEVPGDRPPPAQGRIVRVLPAVLTYGAMAGEAGKPFIPLAVEAA